MKHAMRPFIAGFILLVSTVAFAQTPKNQSDSKGRQGVWKVWLKRNFDESDDSTIAPYYRICTYKDGLAKGPFKDHYRSDALFREGTLKVSEGKSYVEGTVKQYRETGGLDIVEEYLKGIRHGTYRKYAVNGALVAEGEIDDGKRVGEWKTYYENGKVKSRGAYNEGNQDGLWTTYLEDGTVKETTLFDNGKHIQWPELLDRAEEDIDKGNDGAAQRSVESAERSIIQAFGAQSVPGVRLQFVKSRLASSRGEKRLAVLHLDSAIKMCAALGTSTKSAMHAGIDKLAKYALEKSDTAFLSKIIPYVQKESRDPELRVMRYVKNFTGYELDYGRLKGDTSMLQDAINNATIRFPAAIVDYDDDLAEELYKYWMYEALSLYRARFPIQADQCVALANADSNIAKIDGIDSLRSTFARVDFHVISVDKSITEQERNKRILALFDRHQHGDPQLYCQLIAEAIYIDIGLELYHEIRKRLPMECMERLQDYQRAFLTVLMIFDAVDNGDCDRGRSLLNSIENAPVKYVPPDRLSLLRKMITACMMKAGQDSLPSIPPLFTGHKDTTPSSFEATLRKLVPDHATYYLPAVAASATTDDMVRALIIADTTDVSIDPSPYVTSYRTIVDKVRPFVIKQKTPIKQAETLFRVLHDSVLKKYIEHIPLREVFTSGQFNCVSAVALYGLLCHEFKIPIIYYDAPSHMTCGIQDKGQVLLVELTSPKKGFNFTQERDSVIDHLLEYKLITEEEIEEIGRDSVYRNYHDHRRVASFRNVLHSVIGNVIFRSITSEGELPIRVFDPIMSYLVLDTASDANVLLFGFIMLSEQDIRNRFLTNMVPLASYYHGHREFFVESILAYLPSSFSKQEGVMDSDLDDIFQAVYDHAPISTYKEVETAVFLQKATREAFESYNRGHLDTAFVYLRTYYPDSLRSKFYMYYDVAKELTTQLVDDGRAELALRIAREELDANRTEQTRSLVGYTNLRVLNSLMVREIKPERYSALLNEALVELIALDMPASYQRSWFVELFNTAVFWDRLELADSACTIARRRDFNVADLKTYETSLRIMQTNRQIPVKVDDLKTTVSVRIGSGEGTETNVISGSDVEMYVHFSVSNLKIGQVLELETTIQGGGAEPATSQRHRFGAFESSMRYWYRIPVTSYSQRSGEIEITPKINGEKLDPIKVTVQP